ncbi:hypothetical protein BJF93_00925 [Xaviernesmea oryzae]|uniref:DUF3606 domain-containing protein n=1 Tax=Xaviernesmea oryzae TaxID=464029 RepID=A0A1Q9B0S3_9HYPH|nr:hypothetical protein [Xaviernesmea oryzae]OLP61556.1 hypothetical protein BJF93_00925 [Xaviernesmea oryzae]
MTELKGVRGKTIRGEICTLEQFQARYGLAVDEARRLYERFGPSATELDLLMAAKRRQPVA